MGEDDKPSDVEDIKIADDIEIEVKKEDSETQIGDKINITTQNESDSDKDADILKEKLFGGLTERNGGADSDGQTKDNNKLSDK